MRSTLTRGLVIATIVVAGLASPLDRVVVGIPAWQDLGAEAWAAYSRHADLGAGLIVYPIACSWRRVRTVRMAPGGRR